MGILLIILSIWSIYQMFFGIEKDMSKNMKIASLFFLTLLWVMFILDFNSSVMNNTQNNTIELLLPALILVMFGIFLAPHLPKPVKGSPLYELIKGGIIFIVIFAIMIVFAVFFM